MRDLATIQRRFYALVTAGQGAIDPGLLGGSRRLAVYAAMYEARLVDILADDYPKLRVALGAERFGALAGEYLRDRPPTSFTVRDAGLALPRYLATRAEVPAWAPALAALERARTEVFDAGDAAPLTRAALAEVPAEAFPALVLALVPACEIVALGWSVDDAWTAIEDGATPPEPAAVARTVLAWRRDRAVLHRTLDPDEAAVLPLLVAGTTLADVAERIAELGTPEPDQRVFELLARWLDAEILSSPAVG